MIKLKEGILDELKAHGWSTYKIRKEKLFGESTLTKFRKGELAEIVVLDKLCKVLECQPGDLLEYVEE